MKIELEPSEEFLLQSLLNDKIERIRNSDEMDEADKLYILGDYTKLLAKLGHTRQSDLEEN